MTRPQRIITIALTLSGVMGVSLTAQQPPPNPIASPVPQLRTLPPETRRAATLEGELVKVDTTARLLTIKTREGKTEQVRYTDDTRVIGAQTALAGLANHDGTRVTVKFAGTSAARVAAEITVEKSK